MRSIPFAVATALMAFAIAAASDIVPTADIPAASYALWAHLHWVWGHNSNSNQANVTQLVSDYLAHDIPVGAVNIDSTWATQFNNFDVDPNKFPDFASLVSSLHAQDVKVTLWATSFVNVEDPDYSFCEANKYLVRNSSGLVRPIEWWHGSGALIDYSNPDALAWWHSKMDQVLAINGDTSFGVDGFKADASDPYIGEYILSGGALGYKDVPYTSYRQYADFYYGDFLNYTRVRRGEADGLLMSRPVDCQFDPDSQVCWNYSPKFAMTSGWVGDDESDWNGFRGCARKIIYSAWQGYANMGCDIGGYLQSDEYINSYTDLQKVQIFLRWAQFGAFLPLMENGGGGEHRPWMFSALPDITSEQVTDIYKKYVLEHMRLSPYLRTTGSIALASGTSSITPLAIDESRRPDDSKSKRWYPQPSTYSYKLGDALLVHPIMNNQSLVDMAFPSVESKSSSPCTWLDWWSPADVTLAINCGTKDVRRIVDDLTRFPVYVLQGSMLALLQQPQKDVSSYVFTWFLGSMLQQEQQISFEAKAEMRESAIEGPGILATGNLSSKGKGEQRIEVSITARPGPVEMAFVGVFERLNVESSSAEACTSSFVQDKATLVVSCSQNQQGTHIIVSSF